MTSEDVQVLVDEAMQDKDELDWPVEWYEGFEECLSEPYEGNFYVPDSQVYEDFWVVANLEYQDPQSEYLIVFDAETYLFGLANKGDLFEDGSGILIGLYGSIKDVLHNIPISES